MARFVNARIFVACAFGVLALPASVYAQTTWYVDDDASFGGDGLSWDTAFRYLRDALGAAIYGDEIRVAGGTYQPDRDEAGTVTPGDREASFRLRNGVDLLGGYAGASLPGEPDARDVALFETVLTGDLSGDDDPNDFPTGPSLSENSFHVIDVTGTDATTLLDGVTITGGNANASSTAPQSNGGGLYSQYGFLTMNECILRGNVARFGGGAFFFESYPTLTRCVFRGNSVCCEVGSGCAIRNLGSTPTLIDCDFVDNRTTLRATYGGAMANEQSTPTVMSCRFIRNEVASEGGAIHGHYSPAVVVDCVFAANRAEYGAGILGTELTAVNCLFSGNVASSNGGAVRQYNGELVLINCTLVGNAARRVGGIDAHDPYHTPTVTNCILWGNRDLRGAVEAAQIEAYTLRVDHSYLQGWSGDLGGTGNSGENPLFVDSDGPDGDPNTWEDNDYHLYPGSPCIDAANSLALPPDSWDLDGDGDTREHIPRDLDDSARFVDDFCADDTGPPDPNDPDLAIPDIGAYERQTPSSEDVDGDGVKNCRDNCAQHANPDQLDCDDDGLGDVCALALGVAEDCNGNEIPDACDIAAGTSTDENGDGIPDECQGRLFVDDDAVLGGAGLSWTDALNDLQEALTRAAAADGFFYEIRVAQGTYTPAAPGTDRTATFQLINGVALRGGFAGLSDPSDPDARDIAAYETILSGDLDQNDLLGEFPDGPSYADNSFRVVSAHGTDATAILEGITITGGNANTTEFDSGAGIYARDGDPTLQQCTLRHNSAQADGGGLILRPRSDVIPVRISACRFANNHAGRWGGGARLDRAGATLVDCVFVENVADRDGGGLYEYSTSTKVAHCTFSRNAAGNDGGAHYKSFPAYGSIETNCVYAQNQAVRRGGALAFFSYLGYSGQTVVNCLFVDNSAATGSALVQDDGGDAHIEMTVASCTFARNLSSSHTGALCFLVDFPGSAEANVANCVLWDNRAEGVADEAAQISGGHYYIDVNYCCIQGLTGTLGGIGNTGDDPRFVDPNNADYRLASESPCIDAGCSWSVPRDGADLDGDGDVSEYTPLDLVGEDRFVDDPETPDTGCGTPPIVDVGAYEYGDTGPQPCFGDFDGDRDVDLSDLAVLLAHYGESDTCEGDLTCDGEVDLSDLSALLAVYGATCE